jgi:hypothetical protein
MSANKGEMTMIRIIAIALTVLVAAASVADARGRTGSHSYGGYTSHGKGSHYYGSHTSNVPRIILADCDDGDSQDECFQKGKDAALACS